MGELGDLMGIVTLFVALSLFLNVTLFIKIWAMTNHVAEIKKLLKEWLDIEHPLVEEGKDS